MKRILLSVAIPATIAILCFLFGSCNRDSQVKRNDTYISLDAEDPETLYIAKRLANFKTCFVFLAIK